MAREDGRPGERRPTAVLTFLFADIRGYTRFTNELGDEAGSRLSAKHAQVTTEGIEVYGGRVLELSGDEVVGIFESPRSALRAAVELQDAYLDETRLEPYLPMKIGIGLDVGEAVAVGDGYRGSVLNLAARLCNAADAGTVIASESVVHLAGPIEGIGYAALEGRPLKGFDEPVAAWLVAGQGPHDHEGGPPAAADPGKIPSELDPIVPIVGRQADLRWLSWHWRRSRHGHGRLVAVSGPRGSGRTRLVAELATLAHGQGFPVRLARDTPGDGTQPSGPSLLVVEDIDALPAATLDRVLARTTADPEHQLIVVTHAEHPPAAVARRIGGLVTPERRLALGPLNVDAVGEIARLYFEHADDDPPLRLLLEESEGLPAAVHRVASHWARAAAARRLGASARRTSRERRDLRASEAEVIDDVSRLELIRERSRLFVEVEEPAPGERSATAVAICPYKGLAAFEGVDADYYFGRERLIAELIARMVGSAFVGLIGASGSGKSSALQAGLLPALAAGVLPGSDRWLQVPMRPGDHPMRQLQATLARSLPGTVDRDADPRRVLDGALEAMAPSQRMLVVIDQFEELFTSLADEVERSTFIDFITEPRAGLKVLVALRADHYERCADYPGLAGLLASDQVLVGPLKPDEIAAVIRHPAERVGLRVEPELVETLVSDVGAEPGGLPLLSTALLELWEARESGRLTLSAYRATGGVRGAVARLAEAAWAQLESDEQAAARAVFLRLAGEGDGGAIVRRRVRLEELGVDDSHHVTSVLATLTAARLLTADDGHLEVAHEALLREWPRLRGWLEEEGAGRQLRLHLMGATRTWEEGGREDGDLYRGARLGSVLDWSAEHPLELNASERAFIDASKAAAEREAERQRRTNRILRSLLAGAAVLLVVAVGAGAIAALQAGRAEDQAAVAEQNAAVAASAAELAHARELAASAIATLTTDPELSILLALEAAELGPEPAPEAVTALHRAVQASRARLTSPVDFGNDPRPVALGVALSGDGTRLFVQTRSRAVRIHDAVNGELLGTLGEDVPDTVPNHHLGIAISDDDRQLAVVDEGGTIHIWTLDADRTGASASRTIQAFGPGSVGRPAFSADGRRLATVTYESADRNPERLVLQVWDLDSDREISRGKPGPAADVRFHPDGERLLVPGCACSDAEPLKWYDVATGEQETAFTGAFTGADVSPDGTLIATGGADRVGNIWDASTGDHIAALFGHRDILGDVAFSPDGSRLATTGQDGEVRIWAVPSGELELVLAGQVGLIWGVSWSDDGSRLATASAQGGVKIWDMTVAGGASVGGYDLGVARILNLETGGERIAVLGRPGLVGGRPGPTIVVDLEKGAVVRSLPDRGGVGTALTADGARLWTQASFEGSPLGRVDLVDLQSGETVTSLTGICERPGDPECQTGPPTPPWNDQIRRFAISQDDALLATLGQGNVALWSAEGGSLIAVIPQWWLGEVGFAQWGIGFSPDGELLAVNSTDGVVVLDVEGLRSMNRDRMIHLDAELNRAFEAADGEITDDVETATARLEALVPIVTTLPVADAWRVEFTSDGRFVAVASPIGGTRVFETTDWQQRYELRPSWDVSLSPDGTTLATLDTDGIARLWNLADGQLTQTIPVVSRGLGFLEGALRFAPNGRHILVTDAGMLMVHTTDVAELLEVARSRVTRAFTPEECERYLERCPSDSEAEVTSPTR